MILDNVNRKIEVVLSEAQVTNPCAIVGSFFDNAATPPNGGGPTLVNTNGVTPVTAVAAPLANTYRMVNELTVFNPDTVSHGVTVRYNDNGTIYVIMKATLAPGYTLTYSKSQGWAVMTPTGLFIAGQIPGTATNDNAAPGMVGEVISGAASGFALTTATASSITNIILTPGDWEVTASFSTAGSGTSWNRAIGSIGTVNNALNTAVGFLVVNWYAGASSAAFNPFLQVAGARMQVASGATQSVYATMLCDFVAGSATASALLAARRVR